MLIGMRGHDFGDVYKRQGHDAGHAAARADQHRDEALAGEAEAAEDAVHDERDARHIAAILQDAQQQEQHEHLRHEAEHRADAADDACLLYTSLRNVVQRDGGVHHQPPLCARRNALQPLRSAQKRIYPGDRSEEHTSELQSQR